MANRVSNDVSILLNQSIPPNAADLNGDGAVNEFDLSTLLGNWGPCPPAPSACAADLSGDGVVNSSDLAQLVGSWGP